MNIKEFVSLFILSYIVLISCSYSSDFEQDSYIRFKVADCIYNDPLPNVVVSVVSGYGLEMVGATDRTGWITVKKSDLSSVDAQYILFCHDSFYCDALRV